MLKQRRWLGVFLAVVSLVSPSASAFAQASPLMGVWDGVAVVQGAPVPVRYVITAGTAITRQARFPSGLMTFWGTYETVGSQLHIVWHDWAPRQHLFATGPLMDDCVIQFEGPNVFDCGGIRFRRVQ